MKKTNHKLLGCVIVASIVLIFSGCGSVTVNVPAGAHFSGTVNVEQNQSIWKANSASGENVDGRVDALTSPNTDTSLTGL